MQCNPVLAKRDAPMPSLSGDERAKILIPWRISYVGMKLICSACRGVCVSSADDPGSHVTHMVTIVGSSAGVNGHC